MFWDGLARRSPGLGGSGGSSILPAPVERESRNRLKIGLALGGGAARGWSHIGVVRVLHEAGIVPDVVEEAQRVLQARERIRRWVLQLVSRGQAELDALRGRPSMADPRNDLADRAEEIDQLRGRARRVVGHALDRAEDDLEHRLARVRALSPLATLRRGYAVLSDAEGNLLSSVAGVDAGTAVMVRVADGRINADVTQVEPIDLPTIEESDD